MVNGTESRRKNLMSWEILIRSVISQIIMVLVVINMVLNVEHHYDFGKINVGLILYILMIGCSGILDIGQADDRYMMKDISKDGK